MGQPSKEKCVGTAPCAKKSGIKKRTDVRKRKWDRLMTEWVIEGKKLKHLAKEFGLHLQYVQRIIHERLSAYHTPTHDRTLDESKPLILDGTWIVWKVLTVLIAHDGERVVDWMFAPSENFFTWNVFLARLEGRPLGVVSDAQKGLLKAVALRFGAIPHQRCIAHIARQSRIWLTRHPKTEAGITLRPLVNMLYKIQTFQAKDEWVSLFASWLVTHDAFLKERTYGVGRHWWYTHRKLRGVRSLLVRAQGEMFTYLDYALPSTTNHLEGGINGPLQFVFKEHRGLSVVHKKQAVNLFLSARATKRKPTLKVY